MVEFPHHGSAEAGRIVLPCLSGLVILELLVKLELTPHPLHGTEIQASSSPKEMKIKARTTQSSEGVLVAAVAGQTEEAGGSD